MQTSRRQQLGITLVEQAIALAVTSVLVGTTLPAFEQAKARRHLESATAQLRTDLHFARTDAVARNATIRVSFGNDGSCYVVHTGGPKDCSCTAAGASTCKAGAEAYRTVMLGGSAALSVSSNASSIAFDHEKSTATPTGTIQVRNGRGDELRLIVNVMGRVRGCSATPGLPSAPKC